MYDKAAEARASMTQSAHDAFARDPSGLGLLLSQLQPQERVWMANALRVQRRGRDAWDTTIRGDFARLWDAGLVYVDDWNRGSFGGRYYRVSPLGQEVIPAGLDAWLERNIGGADEYIGGLLAVAERKRLYDLRDKLTGLSGLDMPRAGVVSWLSLWGRLVAASEFRRAVAGVSVNLARLDEPLLTPHITNCKPKAKGSLTALIAPPPIDFVMTPAGPVTSHTGGDSGFTDAGDTTESQPAATDPAPVFSLWSPPWKLWKCEMGSPLSGLLLDYQAYRLALLASYLTESEVVSFAASPGIPSAAVTRAQELRMLDTHDSVLGSAATHRLRGAGTSAMPIEVQAVLDLTREFQRRSCAAYTETESAQLRRAVLQYEAHFKATPGHHDPQSPDLTLVPVETLVYRFLMDEYQMLMRFRAGKKI